MKTSKNQRQEETEIFFPAFFFKTKYNKNKISFFQKEKLKVNQQKCQNKVTTTGWLYSVQVKYFNDNINSNKENVKRHFKYLYHIYIDL